MPTEASAGLPIDLGIEVGGGMVLGGTIGYAAKKLAKLFVVLTGIEVGFLGYLESQGIISVDWDALLNKSSSATDMATSAQPPDFLMGFLNTLPFGGGFTVGTIAGWKKA